MSRLDAFLQSLPGHEKTAGTAVPIEKTAEELHLEKLANQNETIEVSTTLALIGEDFCKVAEEGSLLYACGESLLDASQSMTLGLQKVAADNVAGMIVDMVETQDELSKVASVLAELAEDAQDEDFTKIAETVVDINNTLFDELSELAESDESVANFLQEFHKEASSLDGVGHTESTKTEDAIRKVKSGMSATKDAFSAKAIRAHLGQFEGPGGASVSNKLKSLLGSKEGLKALLPALAAYGGSAAVLGGAAYAAKKHQSKK